MHKLCAGPPPSGEEIEVSKVLESSCHDLGKEITKPRRWTSLRLGVWLNLRARKEIKGDYKISSLGNQNNVKS